MKLNKFVIFFINFQLLFIHLAKFNVSIVITGKKGKINMATRIFMAFERRIGEGQIEKNEINSSEKTN